MRREINHLNSDTNQRAEHHKKSGAGFVTFESQYQVRAARTQFSFQIFLQKENKLQVWRHSFVVLLCKCSNERKGPLCFGSRGLTDQRSRLDSVLCEVIAPSKLLHWWRHYDVTTIKFSFHCKCWWRDQRISNIYFPDVKAKASYFDLQLAVSLMASVRAFDCLDFAKCSSS